MIQISHMNLESQQMRVSIICFTKKGYDLGLKIKSTMPDCDIYVKGSFDYNDEDFYVSDSVSEWTKREFENNNVLIFIGAVAIAVRCISPYLKSKTEDSPVIVVDEKGKYVIPILSGHIGGANPIAINISKFIGADAVITTATDLNGVFAVDTWAKTSGYHIVNPDMIKNISSSLLHGHEIGLYSEFPIEGGFPLGITLNENSKSGIVISRYPKCIYENTLMLIPKAFVLGIGCRRNVDVKIFEELILSCLEENKISIHEVMAISTIDIKSDEVAINKFVNKYGIASHFFTANQLRDAKGEFHSSEFVQNIVGVDNVCERACSLLGDKIVLNKQVLGGVTLAVSMINWNVNFDV